MYAAFLTATAAMFRRKQTLMLHLFTTTNNALRSMFGGDIVQAFMTGPYLLPQRLNVQIYWVFREEKLPEMLEEIPLALSRNKWFQHDGAVAHFSRQVPEHLIATCIDRWTEMRWPVRPH